MDSNRFAEELFLLTPNETNSKFIGLPKEFILQIQKSFYCISKNDKHFNYNVQDEILNLLYNYDCSNIEIGPIHLLEKPIKRKDFIIIGNVDIEILALNNITKEILALDHENKDYIVWSCAINGEKFLDALLFCAKILTRRINDESEVNSQSSYLNEVAICTELAGGDKYASFYEMLLL